MKLSTAIACVLISTVILGCAEKETWNPRKSKLYLDNFTAKHFSENTVNADLNFKFNSYAKECAYGIPESGEKLAHIYKQTLNPQSKNYLYFQQYAFANEYNLCMATVTDNITNSKNKISYSKALEKLTEAKPSSVDSLKEIIYSFYINNDATSANYWTRELNTLCKSDATGNLILGKFMFAKANTQNTGYRLIENSAKLGNKEALVLLESSNFQEYRADKPILKKAYLELIQGI